MYGWFRQLQTRGTDEGESEAWPYLSYQPGPEQLHWHSHQLQPVQLLVQKPVPGMEKV